MCAINASYGRPVDDWNQAQPVGSRRPNAIWRGTDFQLPLFDLDPDPIKLNRIKV